MSRKTTIDVEARFIDNMSDGAKDAADAVDDISKAAKDASKETDKLNKKKAKPKIEADTTKFIKKMMESENRAKRFAGKTFKAVLDVKDKASSVFTKILGKARSFAGKTWSGIVKAKDLASSVLSKVSSLGKGIAGKTWTAIVKVKDMALTPLTKIKNMLFNIKTLIGGIVAGAAIKQTVQAGIMQPIALADAYSGAKIGFSTLLGEDKGQQMMDDLDEFAKKSPFDTSGVISNAQKMLAMGWNAEDIVGDMEIIGNAAASTGNLNQGLESIVRAMAQIKTKGKLSAEELNQLAEAGISAKAMLAEQLGYGTGDAGLAAFTADQEKGLIGADKALDALLEGMKKYDGMMDSMANETAEGLMSQLKDTFQVNIMRKWGQGLQDGAKRGLGAVVGLVDKADDALSKFGDTVYEIGAELSNWAADKLEKTISRIQEIVGSDEFKNASLGGKVKMLWDGAIANPLAEWWDNTVIPWWDNTVIPWLAEKSQWLGKAMGSGISNAVAAIFGVELNDTEFFENGVTVGGAFIDGFKEGFDLDKITTAIKEWAEENKGLATGLGIAIGVKLLSGLGGIVGNIKGLFGGGGGGLGSSSVATMTVNAGVVNLNSGGGLPTGGNSTGGAAATGGVGFFGRVFGSTGNAMVNGSGLLGKLASAGYGLTGGAAGSTLSGAAAAGIGGASIIGGIGGALGVGSGIWDIIKGAKSSGKDAKDKYWSGGTKIGMVGSGAAAGAAIGSIIPGAGTAAGALIGAGVGGIGALLGGTKLGKWFSDATDDGGVLNEMGKSIKTFFTDTIPTAWNDLWDGVGNFFSESVAPAWDNLTEAVSTFFTETVPEKWGEFWDGVGNFFSETVPEAWDTLTEKVTTFFTETIPQKWDEFWGGVESFFTETVPYALGWLTGKIYTFFAETIPQKWDELWTAVSNFFTETVPQAWAVLTEKVTTFFTVTIPEKWNEFWDTVSTFFTETIPLAWEVLTEKITTFFTVTLPEKWNEFWGTITNFVTETLPEWGKNIWENHITPFFTETLPSFFKTLLGGIAIFFTELLPEWVAGIIDNHVVPFFSETVPGWFRSAFSAVGGFFDSMVDGFVENIWSPISTFFSETIPGWISSAIEKAKGLWNTIKDSFLSGFESGSGGGGGGGNARGNIIYPSGSYAPGFAAGGLVRGGARLVKVAEEGTPEMIIPLGSQRRDRALKLWMKTGEMLGADRFARGGLTRGGNTEGVTFRRYEPSEGIGGGNVEVDVGGIHVDIHIDAGDSPNIVETIRERGKEIGEIIIGHIADELEGAFANTPARGGAY